MKNWKILCIVRFNVYKTQSCVSKSHTKSPILKDNYTLMSNLFKTDSIVNNSCNILLMLNYLFILSKM